MNNPFKYKIWMPTWLLVLLVVLLWVDIGREAYKYLAFDRPLAYCIRQHLYRCNIGESRVFITYESDNASTEE